MTVTGTIYDSKGTIRPSVPTRFTPMSTLQPETAGVLTSTVIDVVADTNGAFSVVLKHGAYLWSVGYNKRDKAVVVVDDSAATADVRSLIVPAGNLDRVWARGSGVNYQKWIGKLQFYNPTTALFNDLQITGAPSSETAIFGNGNAVTAPLKWVTGLSTYGLNYQLKDSKLQFLNATVTPNTYHTIWVIGNAGTETLSFEAGEAQSITAGLVPLQMVNARVKGSYLQIKHLTSGKYHSLFTSGDDNAVTAAIGASET